MAERCTPMFFRFTTTDGAEVIHRVDEVRNIQQMNKPDGSPDYCIIEFVCGNEERVKQTIDVLWSGLTPDERICL